ADPQLKELLSKPSSDMPFPTRDPLVDAPAVTRRYPGYDFPVSIPGLGQSQAALDAAFEMTADSWQSPSASAPATQVAQTQPSVAATQPSPKVRLVEMPKNHNRVV